MDSIHYVEQILKPNSKGLWIPDEHSFHYSDRTDTNDPNCHIAWTNTWQDLRLQKSINKRNKKLEKNKTLFNGKDGYSKELEYLWDTNPVRAGLEVINHGEIQELHKEFRKVAVRRFYYKTGKGKQQQSVLLRLKTAKPVVWSNEKHDWIDIEVVDQKLHKRFKEVVRFDDRDSDWRVGNRYEY